MPRTLRDLFAGAQALPECDFTFSLQYVQVYLDTIHDLMADTSFGAAAAASRPASHPCSHAASHHASRSSSPHTTRPPPLPPEEKVVTLREDALGGVPAGGKKVPSTLFSSTPAPSASLHHPKAWRLGARPSIPHERLLSSLEACRLGLSQPLASGRSKVC